MTRNGPSTSTDPALTLDQFHYELPQEQIALEPARPRSASRMLLVDRAARKWADSQFDQLAAHLTHGDCLVLNNTRVLKARVTGNLKRSGREVEILFAIPHGDNLWEAMLQPGRRLRDGDTVRLSDGSEIEIGDRTDNGLREVRVAAGPHRTVLSLIESHGTLPLPPYLHRPTTPSDTTDYQTTFATSPGAIAAPTAGLHFTPEVVRTLAERGIETVMLTLHVGIGTFTPVRTASPKDHVLTPERYEFSQSSARALNRARTEGRRIIAVGTTTTRVLEYALSEEGEFVPGRGETDLYILPGFRFRAIDGLLTNFHLPRSTLLMLVAAFASRDLVMDAYKHAVHSGYRFYSYGDCCLFL